MYLSAVHLAIFWVCLWKVCVVQNLRGRAAGGGGERAGEAGGEGGQRTIPRISETGGEGEWLRVPGKAETEGGMGRLLAAAQKKK